MNREEFKQRMKSLKSYREQNPDKGYWDWRASLPDNLRYTDDNEYDMRGAYESGAQPRLEDDGLYHLPTRDPKSGKILKKSIHPTYWKGLAIDAGLGYKPYFIGKDTYTWNDEDGPFIPWQGVEQFQDGGKVPPDNSPVGVNPITNRPLANGAITPVLGLEGAANFTPVGDILSIRDAYIAAQNKDLLGLSLAGLGILPLVPRLGRARAAKRTLDSPTIPTVDRDHFQKRFEEMERRDAKKHQTVDDFYKQRNDVYESLIENEDAFRRAASADANYGTNYRRVYEDYIKEYGRDPSSYNDELVQVRLTDDIPKEAKAQVNPRNLGWINVNSRYADINEVDPVFQQMNPGLVRHEMGHITDERAGLDYVRSLANPDKFEPESRLKEMYPKNYKMIQDYLLNGSEIKSHMNEFRDFLFNKGQYQPNETVKSMRQKLDQYKDQFKGLNILFDVYKNKRQFVKDFNAVPITATEQNNNLV